MSAILAIIPYLEHIADLAWQDVDIACQELTYVPSNPELDGFTHEWDELTLESGLKSYDLYLLLKGVPAVFEPEDGEPRDAKELLLEVAAKRASA